MKDSFRLIALATLFLSACGSGSSAVTCDDLYWDGTAGICVPEGWEVVNRETLRQRGVPEETVFGLQYKEAISDQFPTVVVTEEVLTGVLEPADYSDASIRAITVLNGYERVDQKEITIDGAKVQMHIFTGQPIEGEPKRRFVQVSTAASNKGYTFMAVSPVSISNALEKQIMLMTESFTLEEPKTED